MQQGGMHAPIQADRDLCEAQRIFARDLPLQGLSWVQNCIQ